VAVLLFDFEAFIGLVLMVIGMHAVLRKILPTSI
jgi:hypothetical protein